MTKRSDLADSNNSGRSCRTPPQREESISNIDLKEFHSLLSEMLDPASPALVHRKRRRRAVTAHVSFAEDAFLYASERLMEDLAESWYSKDDLAGFKQERKAVVKALKRAGFDTNAVDKEKYCLRGYEPYFSVKMNKAVKYAREMLTSTVFSEQKRQQMLNIHEPETIRDCSCNASAWARGNSHELGVLDSLECFALSLNLDALSLQEPTEPMLKSRQAKEQEKLQLEKDIKILTPPRSVRKDTKILISPRSIPGAFQVDHAPDQDKDIKMRSNEGSSSSAKPGAYHVDYRQPAPEKHDELSMRGPEHMDHETVADHMQQSLRFISY
jgi:hypothetical protein